MLPVRSHANADLFNSPDANLSILGEIFWHSYDTIYYQLRNFEYVKDLLFESTSQHFLAPAPAPSANIASHVESETEVDENFITFS